MPKLIFIDQIAQGGEQGWSQPHIPQSEREPEVKKYPTAMIALVWAGMIGYCFLFWWGALDGWKYVGRR